jgi:tight adherence protein C
MDITLTVTLLAVFGAVALSTGALVSAYLDRTSPTRRRIDALVPSMSATTGAGHASERSLFNAPLPRVATLVPRSPQELGRLRRRLMMAGYHAPGDVGRCLSLQLALVACLGGLPLLLLGPRGGLVPALFGAAFGYLAPGLVLDRATSKRKRRIQNGLPDALDLLIVSIEAGLALDQAIAKCAEELQLAHPDLAEELRLVAVENRAGKPRLEAFKNLAARTMVDDVRALVTMLVQTDRFGTSVAQALRTHADVSRTKRRQRAEERAAKIGVKLVFPLVFCLFPAFYVVTLGPAIIKFIHAFGPGGFATGVILK